MKTLLPNKLTWDFPNYIHVDGQKIDTPLGIAEKFNNRFCKIAKAEKFNNRFCKIGEAVAEKVKPSNLCKFLTVSRYATVLVLLCF